MSNDLRKAFNNYWNNQCLVNARRLLAAYKREQAKGILLSRDECDTIADARFMVEVRS